MSGYSSSVKAILRVKEYLDVLVNARASFEWRVSNPHKFAYQLREGFKVARQFKDQYSLYAGLSEKFTIRVTKNTVFAQMKDVLDVQPIAAGKITIADARTPMEVVGAAIMHSAPIMHFPNASLDPIDKKKLDAWAETSDYACNIANGNDGIILNKK
jgi:hypothetical protein